MSYPLDLRPRASINFRPAVLKLLTVLAKGGFAEQLALLNGSILQHELHRQCRRAVLASLAKLLSQRLEPARHVLRHG